MLSWIFASLFSWTGIILVTILTILYLWGTHHNEYFKRRGIPYIKPYLFVGSTGSTFLRKETFLDMFLRFYWTFPKESVVGAMQTLTPIFLIRDPVLVREITVKNFEHFRNHVFDNDPDLDPVFGRSIFAMNDQKWKVTRNLLSPAFTGSKMRIMFKLMRDCAKSTVNALIEKHPGINKSGAEVEMKDFFTRYANDTIATTTFGIEVSSVKEPENEFYTMGRKMTSFGQIGSIKFLLAQAFPKLLKMLKVNLLDKEATDYFVRIVKDTISYRIKNKIVRPDILNMYIEQMKDEDSTKSIENEYTVKVDDDVPKTWDYEEFVAQCILFFFAGFETTATFFMLMAYEITINPDVQNKLLKEIDELNEKIAGKEFTYEDLHDLKYLDMVMQEAARMWPITVGIDRKCNKDITLTDSQGQKKEFKDGDVINLLAIGIQRDPAYFDNPDKFIPERFSPENKDKLNQFALLSFGIGPRMCMGNRFAMTECKCIFYTLLSKFRFETGDKTQTPIKFKKGTFALIPESGAWIKLVPRK